MKNLFLPIISLLIISNVQSQNCISLFNHSNNGNTFIFDDASINLSLNTPTYYWTFGDGNVDTKKNTSHTYKYSDNYEVCLTMTAGNCSSKSCDTVFAPVLYCKADLSISQSGKHFVFEGLYEGQSPKASQAWFADNVLVSTDNKFTYYDYQHQNKPFEIKYVYRGTDGCQDTAVKQITCAAHFEIVTQKYGYVDVRGNSYGFGNLSYQTSLGDGYVTNNQHTNHLYSTSGVYEICQIVSSSTGCSDTFCQEVIIYVPPCKADFTYLSDNRRITFINLSSDSINPRDSLSYYWSFGDGNYSRDIYVNHQYAKAGKYTVCLILSSRTGCSDTICKTINVFDNTCTADFKFKHIKNKKYKVKSISSSQDSIRSYRYVLNGQDTFTTANFRYKFPKDSTIIICLEIETYGGCTRQVCKSVRYENGNLVVDGQIQKMQITEQNAFKPSAILTVYPNPTSHTLNFNFAGEIEGGQLYIMNIQGQAIRKQDVSDQNLQIDVSALAPGIYVYIFTSDGMQQKGYFIKQE